MAHASPSFARFLLPLQVAVEWLGGSTATPVRNIGATGRNPQLPRRAPVTKQWHGPVQGRLDATRPALRVVRVVDAGPPSHGAGRMVISGRLHDVCAELDRLAELEDVR